MKRIEGNFHASSAQRWPISGAAVLCILWAGLQSGLAKLPANQLVATVSVGSNPFAIAVSPDSSVVYNNQIAGPAVLQFIDTATGTLSTKVVASAKIASGGMSIDPSGLSLYISDGYDYVTEAEAATGKVKRDFIAVASPFDLTVVSTPVVTPSLAYLYVANYVGNHGTDDEVLMVDLAEHKVKGAPVTIGLGPHDLAIAPNGNTLYVSNQQTGTVSVINIQVP